MLTLLLSNVVLSIDEAEAGLRRECALRTGVQEDELGPVRVVRRSLDARHPGNLRYVYTVEVDALMSRRQAALLPDTKVVEIVPEKTLESGSKTLTGRPIIVGAGPAGLFAAWRLAEQGYRPILLERGKPVQERRRDTSKFWNRGELDPDSNVLFGEGGAGAFSDGKLTTRSKDPLRAEVMRRFVDCGAPNGILVEARPHLGTDRLNHVLCGIRERLLALGTEIRFSCRVDGFAVGNGLLLGVHVGTDTLPTNALVLACGHSARDTYRALRASGVALEPKPFAMGIRVQHLQDTINRGQYGKTNRGAELGTPAAEYVLRCATTHVGRSVYSFCMCPGGAVIPCASEAGGVFCNGMSGKSRGGEYANGAIVAQIPTSDFESEDPLAGVDYQRMWETKAFRATGGTYALPMMALRDFVKDTVPTGRDHLAKRRFPRAEMADLRVLLPASVSSAIREASVGFARTIDGWLDGSAVAFGVETRTSSPVRILRGDNGQSVNVAGLYPAGEGAGYAGGIVSSAIDGMRAAEHLINEFAPPRE